MKKLLTITLAKVMDEIRFYSDETAEAGRIEWTPRKFS
jgi:hypothetical protein